jgi:hypothetical protein
MTQHSFRDSITHESTDIIWSNAVGEFEPLAKKTKEELIQLNSDIKTCRIVFKKYEMKRYWLKRIQTEYDKRRRN